MDASGDRIVDFKKHNLHVVGYSEPVDEEMTFSQLDFQLHSLPSQPNAIPYVTSYYKRQWGFCITDLKRNLLREDPDARYKVKIDSDLKPGVLNYGELIIRGTSNKEILLSTYVCHPSMANNELSGPCVLTALAQSIQKKNKPYFTYRILFLVETIGSIVYLSKHLEQMKKNTVAGFVLTCLGDNNNYSYIASKEGNSLADNVAQHVLDYHTRKYKKYSFLERGSDERQYCSVGIDLPVCSICRTKYNEYPEYHTSMDDLEFISPDGLQGAYDVYGKILLILENNETYRCKVKCEPQLGKRGLYPNLSTKETYRQTRDMMNLIAYSDGSLDLLEISKKIGTYMGDLIPIATKLEDAGVLEKVSTGPVSETKFC